MRTEMFTAAEALDFERAARLRDELKRLEALAGKDGVALDGGAVYDPYAGGTKKAKSRSSRGASSSNNAASKAKASGRRPRTLQALRRRCWLRRLPRRHVGDEPVDLLAMSRRGRR